MRSLQAMAAIAMLADMPLALPRPRVLRMGDGTPASTHNEPAAPSHDGGVPSRQVMRAQARAAVKEAKRQDRLRRGLK